MHRRTFLKGSTVVGFGIVAGCTRADQSGGGASNNGSSSGGGASNNGSSSGGGASNNGSSSGGRSQELSGTMKIGSPVALTGAYSAEARDQLDAVKLAAKDIDASNQYSFNVDVTSSDTELSPSNAVQQVRRMVRNQNIDFLVGATSSSTGTSLAPVAQQSDLIFMSPNGTDLLNGAECNSHTFQIAASSAMSARGIAPLVLNNNTFGDNWYMIAADYGWGHDVRDELKKIAEENGKNVTGTILSPFGASDFSNFFSQVQSSDVDTLFLIQYGASNGTAIKQAVNQGLHQQMEIVSPLTLMTAARGVSPEALSNIYAGNNWYHGLNNEDSQRFVTSFTEQYNRIPSDLAQTSYKSVMLLADVAKQAGSFEAQDIIPQMEGYTYEMFKGDEKIRACDHLTRQSYFQLKGKAPPDKENDADFFEVIDTTSPDQTTPPCSSNCSL